jgi:hypothetical protein
MKRFPALFQFQPLALSLQPFPRHRLAGVLARERPALFRALPESFKVGLELPEKMDFARTTLNRPLGTFSRSHGRRMSPHPGPLPRAERVNHRPRFVHGCELLAI